MRVRVIRWTDPTSSQANLAVQRWCAGQWESVGPEGNFPLCESEQANEFAMKLSMSKRIPTELTMYNDGEKVEGGLAPLFVPPERVESGPPELAFRVQKSENQS